MIKIYCDICGKEPEDKDFIFEATKAEMTYSLIDKDIPMQKTLHKELIQICKGCYYVHISKLLKKNEK